ncbi:MAG: hypothetical protein MI924_26095 [Chloroflexales bacterium]|nr:hypothetical protein [Chloroflexales bacterium]
MNQMSQQDLQQHVTILGWLHIIGHALFLIIGLFIFTLLTGIGAFTGDPEAVAILSVVGTLVGALLAILGIPGILAGYGLLKRRSWGRYLAIVIGILNLVNFPVGTLIGIYTLWVLLQEEANSYFIPMAAPMQPQP